MFSVKESVCLFTFWGKFLLALWPGCSNDTMETPPQTRTDILGSSEGAPLFLLSFSCLSSAKKQPITSCMASEQGAVPGHFRWY